MSSAGKLLQKERLSQDRTLTDIASITCIARRYLQAIEEDDAAVLPGDFFYRSYIKQYAQALKLDDRAISTILAAAVKLDTVDPLPALSMAYKTAKTEGRLSGRHRPGTGTAIVLLGLALVGCSGVYAVWHQAQIAKETSVEPAVVQPQKAAETQPAPPTATQADSMPEIP